jgi:hypothetical protein
VGFPDPLARLHQTTTRLGITVLDDAAAASGWPEENTAAIVSFGQHIALKPGLDDDLRADVLAMALIVAAVMGDRPTGHRCAITAPDGLVVISRTPRGPAPVGTGPGRHAAGPRLWPGHRIRRIRVHDAGNRRPVSPAVAGARWERA